MINKRRAISQRTRVLVLSRDKSRCRMCGRDTNEVKLEVDHIFPHSQGGTDDIDNLATLCRDCNRGKSDLFLRSLLKDKITTNDFSPIGEILLKVSYTKLHIDPKLHEYELVVEVLNDTSKSIVNPQLEVKLPWKAIQTVSSRGQIEHDENFATVFFANLDTELIHPKKTTKLITTANIGLFYKMDENIYWNDKLMQSQFELTLYGEDMPPTTFKKPFEDMQCF